MKFKGKVWLFGDDINTDLMHPGFIKSLPENERPKYCMHANRPEWSELVEQGDIIVAGRNFGCGSSRDAARNLKSLGISCVISDSINGLFLRTAINFGLPAMNLKGVSRMFEEGDIAEVDFRAGQVRNVAAGNTIKASRLPEKLINIIESGGLIPLLKKNGYI